MAAPTVAPTPPIPDNPRPLSIWTAVQNPPDDDVCLCVHGAIACSDDWLAGAIAQMPAGAGLILIGANARVAAGREATRLGTLADDAPLALLPALAPHLRGRHAVVVRGDAQLPPFAVQRLLRALDAPEVLAAGALDNLDATRSPLPEGRQGRMASPARIDALCHAYAQPRLIDVEAVSPLASAWHGSRLQRRDADERTRMVMLDHLYVAARERT